MPVLRSFTHSHIQRNNRSFIVPSLSQTHTDVNQHSHSQHFGTVILATWSWHPLPLRLQIVAGGGRRGGCMCVCVCMCVFMCVFVCRGGGCVSQNLFKTFRSLCQCNVTFAGSVRPQHLPPYTTPPHPHPGLHLPSSVATGGLRRSSHRKDQGSVFHAQFPKDISAQSTFLIKA